MASYRKVGALVIEFLGKIYPAKPGEEMIEYALDLADCGMDPECGRTATRALQLCAVNGWCGETVADSLRLGLDRGGPFSFSQVDALSRQVVQAVRFRVAALMPKL